MTERLLLDVRRVFQQRDESLGKRQASITTVDLIKDLIALDEAPWGAYYGRAIEDRDIAKLLRSYGIKSKTVRVSSDGARARKGAAAQRRGKTARGYRRDDLEGVWERYL
jgi:hypothetical protein